MGLSMLRGLSQQPRPRVRLRFRVSVGKRQSLQLPPLWFGKGAAKGWVRLHSGSSPNSFSPRLKLIQGQGLGLAQRGQEWGQKNAHVGLQLRAPLLPHLPSATERDCGCPSISQPCRLLPFPAETLLPRVAQKCLVSVVGDAGVCSRGKRKLR